MEQSCHMWYKAISSLLPLTDMAEYYMVTLLITRLHIHMTTVNYWQITFFSIFLLFFDQLGEIGKLQKDFKTLIVVSAVLLSPSDLLLMFWLLQ